MLVPVSIVASGDLKVDLPCTNHHLKGVEWVVTFWWDKKRVSLLSGVCSWWIVLVFTQFIYTPNFSVVSDAPPASSTFIVASNVSSAQRIASSQTSPTASTHAITSTHANQVTNTLKSTASTGVTSPLANSNTQTTAPTAQATEFDDVPELVPLDAVIVPRAAADVKSNGATTQAPVRFRANKNHLIRCCTT